MSHIAHGPASHPPIVLIRASLPTFLKVLSTPPFSDMRNDWLIGLRLFATVATCVRAQILPGHELGSSEVTAVCTPTECVRGQHSVADTHLTVIASAGFAFTGSLAGTSFTVSMDDGAVMYEAAPYAGEPTYSQ
ncbi:hypothetical protein OIV83_001342 [Microbotryomycetes sp. JL201]|nr:hypothetical protein OIV83_001342 [Microbotryomycetes sp. JL201]